MDRDVRYAQCLAQRVGPACIARQLETAFPFPVPSRPRWGVRNWTTLLDTKKIGIRNLFPKQKKVPGMVPGGGAAREDIRRHGRLARREFKLESRGFYQLKPVRVAGPVGPGVEKDGCLTCFGALSLVSARVWFDTRPGLVAGVGRRRTRRSLAGQGGLRWGHVGAQGSRSRRLADICAGAIL